MSDKKTLSKKRYTQFASGYVTSETHAKGSDLDTLLTIADPQASWRVLDIATGGGHTALKFAPHVAQVMATDLTPNMLAEAERFITGQGVTNVKFRLADAENLPFEDASFDCVTCRIAPHHFPDVPKFVSEAVRVLKIDGTLVIQDHMLSEDSNIAQLTEAFETLRDPSHNRAYSQTEWMRIVIQSGIKMTATHHLTKRHILLPWARRQGNDDATIAQLRKMVADASDEAQAWMAIQAWDSDEASFVNHHLIIAGTKMV